MSSADRGPVVLDPNVFSAELVRTGAVLAGWGDVRHRRLEQRISRATIVWPGPELVDTYTRLRVWCLKNGHGLGQKIHEADRWIAATAMFLNVPLVAHDAVFRGVDGLGLISTLPEPQ